MTQSRLFMLLCLATMLGMGTANLLQENWMIILAVPIIMLVFIFSPKRGVRVAALLGIFLYLGLALGKLSSHFAFDSSWLKPINEYLFALKTSVVSLVDRLLSEPYAGLMNGIMIGEKSGMGFDLKQDFKTTGLTHIIAISGYNVTIIINSFYIMTKPIPYKLRIFLSLVLIFLFVIFTGGSASVIRAGIMGALTIVARLFGRQSIALNSLILTAFLMVAGEPSILLNDIGFQLSFAATLGLIFLTPILNDRVGERGLIKKMPSQIKEALISTLAAQAMTAPIIFNYFKNLSLVSPIANLIVLPLIPLLMTIGFMVIAGGLAFYPLGYLFSFGAFVVLKFVVWITKILASIPYAGVLLPDWLIILIIPYYGLLFWLIFRKKRKIYEKV